MNKIILISCVSRKENQKAKAEDLYKGPLFKYSLCYARKLNPHKIFILSAKHHLLDLGQEIQPYDVTLANVPKSKRKPGLVVLGANEKKVWGQKVVQMLAQHADLQKDQFIILAGNEYLKPIQNELKNIETPLEGMRQGERVKFLKQQCL